MAILPLVCQLEGQLLIVALAPVLWVLYELSWVHPLIEISAQKNIVTVAACWMRWCSKSDVPAGATVI
ncbi:MAG: hypothetical protein P8H97_06465 [Pseudomonadales bacterium]|nr:hypothetical protein [Pseudomonadales bacterium]MDG2080076.1 hypothetical protein [Pseudomonadales bacterium]